MITVVGTVERITYYNSDNGYTVLRLRPDKHNEPPVVGLNLEGLLTVVGNFPETSPGEQVEVEGDYITHAKHGLQFQGKKFNKRLPVTGVGIERYLGSGLIKGIGPQLAKRIVKHFKTETLEVIERDPHRLKEVPGIGPDRAEKIIRAWEEQKAIKTLMLFLHEHQVSTNLAVKIYKVYGEHALEVVRDNPYQLEQDIYGVGFKTADRIAQNLGLSADHPARIEAGIIFIINEMINDGHVYTPFDLLTEKAGALLQVAEDQVLSGINRLTAINRIRKITIETSDLPGVDPGTTIPANGSEPDETVIYLTQFFQAEMSVAEKLCQLMDQPMLGLQETLEFKTKDLAEEQRHAIRTALMNPVSILTGGPGTGKTTCLKALIDLLEANNRSYALASPTGRAAKRLSEATGRAASTIHRLLGYSPLGGFQHHEDNPLKTDFLIIDEASMLDLLLMFHLLRSIRPGTQVLFVGDVDQLPSVSAGDVLRDMISSGMIPVSQLSTIFRQAANSQIVTNAHAINRGVMPSFSTTGQGDFFLFPAEDAESAVEWVVGLVSERIPNKFGYNPIQEIQVLSPMHRGVCGVRALNERLQAKLNPEREGSPSQKLFGTVFRVGDKVMQLRNNYEKEVFNGDIGFITKINPTEQNLVVLMDGSRKVTYDFNEADEIVLAYAISVHKSQGSEFQAVIFPVLTQHYLMLQRNLIYTAITRAKKLCVVVGNNKALRIAVNDNQVSKRYSNLSQRLRHLLSHQYRV